MLAESNHPSYVLPPGRAKLNSRQYIKEKVGGSHPVSPGGQADHAPSAVASEMDSTADAMLEDSASCPNFINNFSQHPPRNGQEPQRPGGFSNVHQNDESYKLNLIAPPENDYVVRSPVSHQLKEDIRRILEKFGVQHINAFIEDSSANILYGICNLEESCYCKGLARKIEFHQLKAFFEHMNKYRYSPSSIRSQYKGVEKLAAEIQVDINVTTDSYERVWLDQSCAACRSVKEAPRIPVNLELLSQLCAAAPQVFWEYESKLNKAVFTMAYALAMRQSEYTHTSATKSIHNIWANRVQLDKHGVGVEFASHKGNQAGHSQFRHVLYTRLPPSSKQFLEEYDAIRPKEATYYFCLEDGACLTPNMANDFLHVCLLLTDWGGLKVTSHSFRAGRSFVEIMLGNVSHSSISFQARWQSHKTAECYKKAPLVAQNPQQIAESCPECIQVYSTKHLKWLTQVVVMTYGKKEDYPFMAALQRWAPEFVAHYFHDIPDIFPHPRAIQAMAARRESVRSGLVVQQQLLLREQVLDWQAQANWAAKALRYTALKNRAYARRTFLKEEALKKQKALQHRNNEACTKPTVATQTGVIMADIIKSTTTDVASQCLEDTQYLTPEMLADAEFLQKAVVVYEAHKLEVVPAKNLIQPQSMVSVANQIQPQLQEKSYSDLQYQQVPAVKTGYTISKLEGIQTTKRGGKNMHIDNRRRSPLTNDWVTKEQADAEEASGKRLKKHHRISKGNSDLCRIKKKIMYHISEKYRANRRATYARANMNKKLKEKETPVPRQKAEASFQKTITHKKLIEYFQYTVAAMGGKPLPCEFDCTRYPDEDSDAYYRAVIDTYTGIIITADGSNITPTFTEAADVPVTTDNAAPVHSPPEDGSPANSP